MLKKKLEKKKVKRGTGYYIWPRNSRNVYLAWKDSKTVAVMTSAYPGHSNSTIRRRVKNPQSGASEVVDVPIPAAINNYNRYMGGVDKSDQFLSYNRLLQKTVRYWKTMFYHLIRIIVTNCSILQNWQRMAANKKKRSRTECRDRLVQQIIMKYGHPSPPPQSTTVHHGSCYSSPLEHKLCALCHVQKTQ